MNDAVAGTLALLVGIAALIWHGAFARHIIEEQNRLFRFKFGEREVARTKIIVLIVGAGFVVFGLLLISGVWEIGR